MLSPSRRTQILERLYGGDGFVFARVVSRGDTARGWVPGIAPGGRHVEVPLHQAMFIRLAEAVALRAEGVIWETRLSGQVMATANGREAFRPRPRLVWSRDAVLNGGLTP